MEKARFSLQAKYIQPSLLNTYISFYDKVFQYLTGHISLDLPIYIKKFFHKDKYLYYITYK